MTFPQAAVKRYARLIGGATPSADERNWNGNINWLSPMDVSACHGGYVGASVRTLTESGLENCSAIVAPAGSVVVTTRAPIGNVAITTRPSATNQGCRTLVPGPNLEARFLRYQLQVRLAELQARGAGSTFQELSGATLGATKVNVPDIQIQREVVDFLDRECECISRLMVKLNYLEASLKEALQASVDELVWGGDPHIRSSLRWYGCRCVTGPFGTALSADEYVSGGVPLVNPTHIRDGRIFPSAHESVSVETANRLERYRLKVGDLVVGRKGDLGRSAVVSTHEAGWVCGSDSIALRPNLQRLRADFVAALMRTTTVRHGLLSRSSGATLANMNERSLLAAEAPLYSLCEQATRVQLVIEADMKAEQLRTRLSGFRARLVEYRDALITEVMTDEGDVVRTSEPQRAERAQGGAGGSGHLKGIDLSSVLTEGQKQGPIHSLRGGPRERGKEQTQAGLEGSAPA